MPDFAAVLFDLDGTLCESTQSETAIYEGAFEHAGVDPVGRPGDLWAALDGPPDPDDEQQYLAAGFRRVLADHDREGLDPAALAAGFIEAVEYGAVAFLSGAERALAAARENGPVGLVTNGPERRQAPKVETLALESSMETIVYAGDMPRRKPHPDPFERAVDDLGVDPERTLYVGNSLEYDVGGAHAAGLRAAWFRDGAIDDTDPSDSEANRPDYTLASMADLREVLHGD